LHEGTGVGGEAEEKLKALEVMIPRALERYVAFVIDVPRQGAGGVGDALGIEKAGVLEGEFDDVEGRIIGNGGGGEEADGFFGGEIDGGGHGGGGGDGFGGKGFAFEGGLAVEEGETEGGIADEEDGKEDGGDEGEGEGDEAAKEMGVGGFVDAPEDGAEEEAEDPEEEERASEEDAVKEGIERAGVACEPEEEEGEKNLGGEEGPAEGAE